MTGVFKAYRDPEYQKLLDEDKDVERWYQNLSKGSVIVADIYLRRLGSFCRENKITPGKLAKLPVAKIENLAMDFINDFETKKTNPETGKKYAPGYIESHLKAIKSWASWKGKPFRRKIKVRNSSKRPTLEDERSPTQQELHSVLYAASTPLRARVSISLTAFSGPRLEVQGDYLGLDGLRMRDLPELEISKEGKVSFKKVPTMIIVREEISKSRHQYFTFYPQEGCEFLKLYLEQRIAGGEKLLPDSVIVASSSVADRNLRVARNSLGIEDKSPFMRTTKIGEIIRKAMRAVGLPWRPYVFRSYFDTNLMLAESKGLCSHAYQQFWMGHKGDIESQYTTRKKSLPENVVEDMREKFARLSKELLETGAMKTGVSSEIDARLTRRLLRTVRRMTDEEIDKLGDLSKLSEEEFDRLMQPKKENYAQIVAGDQVKELISKGWTYLPNPFVERGNEAVMMPPATS